MSRNRTCAFDNCTALALANSPLCRRHQELAERDVPERLEKIPGHDRLRLWS